jgi:hypothetical protein
LLDPLLKGLRKLLKMNADSKPFQVLLGLGGFSEILFFECLPKQPKPDAGSLVPR